MALLPASLSQYRIDPLRSSVSSAWHMQETDFFFRKCRTSSDPNLSLRMVLLNLGSTKQTGSSFSSSPLSLLLRKKFRVSCEQGHASLDKATGTGRMIDETTAFKASRMEANSGRSKSWVTQLHDIKKTEQNNWEQLQQLSFPVGRPRTWPETLLENVRQGHSNRAWRCRQLILHCIRGLTTLRPLHCTVAFTTEGSRFTTLKSLKSWLSDS